MLWYCKGVDFTSILEELWYGNINPSEDKEVSDKEKKLVGFNGKTSGISNINT